MTTDVGVRAGDSHVGRRRREKSRSGGKGSAGAQFFMMIAAVLWLLPIAFAFYVAIRPYSETAKYGYVSWPRHLTLKNFGDAWTQSDMKQFFLNSVYITVPAVIITLLLASAVAFIVSRVNLKFNVALLIMFAAGNLLPQQVLITPIYRLYLQVHVPAFVSSSGLLYDSYAGLIIINISFQLGFCVFVLSNYMKSIPEDIYEAAEVDRASPLRQFSAKES